MMADGGSAVAAGATGAGRAPLLGAERRGLLLGGGDALARADGAGSGAG